MEGKISFDTYDLIYKLKQSNLKFIYKYSNNIYI